MGIPPLGKFVGKVVRSRKIFIDWIEQFELVASVCHWDNHAKLVNLRLMGQMLFISHVAL